MLHRLGRRRVAIAVAAAVVLIWLGSGLYIVNPGERGVVLLFGRLVGQTEPGLRYRLPVPIESHTVVDVARVRRAEIGFRADRGATRAAPGESLMLTGDENIVDVQLFVQYMVQDPVKFLFRAREPERALQRSAEIALRAAVEGGHSSKHILISLPSFCWMPMASAGPRNSGDPSRWD
jgi:membrane protease subunit HflK